MSLTNFNVPDELFPKAKQIREAMLKKEIAVDSLDNKRKNLLLEFYRTAQKYAGLELQVVEKQIQSLKDLDDSATLTDMEAKKATILDNLQGISDEVETSLRVSGLSLLSDFPVDHPPLN